MVKENIAKLVEKAIKTLQKEKVFPEFVIPEVLVEHPDKQNNGDYSVNIALKLAKTVKKNPQEIAEAICAKIKPSKAVEKIEAVSGFINFYLSMEFFQQEISVILRQKDKYGSQQSKKTVVIDYSAPNIAKPFGIGHLRSTIIGQALYNIYQFLGWKCIGDNHLGDWGTQFGKLIYQIKKKIKPKDWKKLSINELEKLYVEFHKEAETYPEMEEEARSYFKKLEKGDKEAKTIWQACVDTSLKEFDRIYKMLGIKIDYALGESFYGGEPMQKIVAELAKKKISAKSQGAIVIKYANDELPPAMILKSDKATTYFLRDLATIKYRLKTWRPDIFVYEIGADQYLHLKQLFSAVKSLGWVKKQKLVHVAHGMIRWEHGKFSTRKGQTIHLEEVLQEAISRAMKIIESAKANIVLSEKEKKEISEIVGIGAIKYNDLSQHHSRDIIFSWEKILSMDGNSGPYLQYTVVRCQSVAKKAKAKKLEVNLTGLNEAEKNILKTIYKFPEIIQLAADNFSPNLICNFAHDLAQKYNLFYNQCPILSSENKETRLALNAAVGQVLKSCLKLLGISIPKKM
ncbi:arginine--tRNA ligase [Candidatus Parcubacteria bacterium]|nr:arginine--tRNA ligase [Candidatus Parcubacteria bacterium]